MALPIPCAGQGDSSRQKPVVLVFDLAAGVGVSGGFAVQAAQDLKTYLTETNRVDAFRYNSNSPVVERAVIEKSLTREKAVSPMKPEVRVSVAKLFAVQYFTNGDLAVSDNNVDLTLALTEVDTGRKWVSHQRAAVSIAQGGDPKRNLENARRSALRTAVMQIAQDAFATVPAAVPEPPAAADLSPPTLEPAISPDEKIFADYMARVDRYLKEGNLTSASSELKRAINVNPKALESRIKLADIYLRQMKYDQAIDELRRARELAPENVEVLKSLAAAYEAQGSLSDATAVYEALAAKSKPGETAALRIAMGDLYWKHAKIGEAVKQYTTAIESAPRDSTPHLRLARVFAAQAQFKDCAREIEASAKLTPEGSPVIDSETFQGFLKIADSEIRAVYAQYQVNEAAYRKQERTREDYHNTARELGDRAAALADFLDKLPSPKEFRVSKRHRVLGLTLFSQGTASLMTFLESDDEDARTESVLYFTEAVKEFQTAFDLDKEALNKR